MLVPWPRDFTLSCDDDITRLPPVTWSLLTCTWACWTKREGNLLLCLGPIGTNLELSLKNPNQKLCGNNFCFEKCIRTGNYRAFSLTWLASMLIYWNKRNHLREKRVQLLDDFLGTPTWPPFHGFGAPIWPP